MKTDLPRDLARPRRDPRTVSDVAGIIIGGVLFLAVVALLVYGVTL
jgi:hypothetical protein